MRLERRHHHHRHRSHHITAIGAAGARNVAARTAGAGTETEIGPVSPDAARSSRAAAPTASGNGVIDTARTAIGPHTRRTVYAARHTGSGSATRSAVRKSGCCRCQRESEPDRDRQRSSSAHECGLLPTVGRPPGALRLLATPRSIIGINSNLERAPHQAMHEG
jgi:hypothetical protein